jgi:hypothetical protein
MVGGDTKRKLLVETNATFSKATPVKEIRSPGCYLTGHYKTLQEAYKTGNSPFKQQIPHHFFLPAFAPCDTAIGHSSHLDISAPRPVAGTYILNTSL